MIRKFVKEFFNLHDIDDLQLKSYCGCCGKIGYDEIVEKIWAVKVCKNCRPIRGNK